MRMRCVIAVVLIAFVSFGSQAAERCSIAWSHYTGWEPLGYIQSSGIAKRWGQKKGVDLQFVLVNDYSESISQYTAGGFDGVSVTNMDALVNPAYGGLDTTVVVVGDYSNGNDGILVQGPAGSTVQNMRGKQVKLVQYSVSHYLLARALGMNGMTEKDLGKIINVSDADLGSLIATNNRDGVFVTWNPILMTGRNVPGYELVFDSSKIPGEIIDTVVVRTAASDACKDAVAGAWYEVMGIMAGGGAEADKAIHAMAKAAGGTNAEFLAQLKTTYMFYTPADAVAFARDPKLAQTMAYVAKFSFEQGLFKGAKDADAVGIAFPDGSMIGNKDNAKLRFVTRHMENAAKK